MNEWIDVKEKLPEPYQFVLTWEKCVAPPDLRFEDQAGIACRFSTGEWCQRSDHRHYSITHWMPLPDPPK